MKPENLGPFFFDTTGFATRCLESILLYKCCSVGMLQGRRSNIEALVSEGLSCSR